MMQSHRISTNIGKDQLVTVELKQDYDLLEILSLKFSQQDVYTSLCSDYGVVCGRISVNNGLGIPNARVSIFVPLKDVHANDPIISALYPYTSISSKDENGYRYNLLPSRQQHGGHTATGTFPDQTDILTREEILEVYETYYSYTVKTNNAGDFMIWGVPLGQQSIHVDVDLSDIGCFSLRPYDFIRQGKGVDNFKNKYKFKSSEDLDSLPQVVSFDKNIEVYPFWGNVDICDIGITRTDFDLSDRGVTIQPKAFIIGGQYTDSSKNSVNKNCTPRKKMGRKCDLVAKSGKIEAIRFTPLKDDNHRPILEEVNIHEDIPDDGSYVFPIEMNMDYLFTNEFGENEITNDPNKGVPTSGCYRFRFNMNDNGLERARANADYLVPNIREYSNDIDKSYAFSTDWTGYPHNSISLMTNFNISEMSYGYYPKDYFYRFNYNKVYTVSSFHHHFVGSDWLGTTTLANVNDAHPSEEEDCGDKTTPPTNFGFKNYTFTLLIADFLLLLDYVFKLLYLSFLNVVIKDVLNNIAEIIVSWGGGREPRHALTRLQISTTTKLSLINYPECEECNTESNQTNTGNTQQPYCSIGELSIIGAAVLGNKTVSSENYFTSTTCTTTNLVADRASFIANQTKYILFNSIANSYITLDNDSYFTEIGGDLIFVDTYGAFYLSGFTYTNIQIYDLESFTLPDLQSESGCGLYDTLYDEDLITGYYVPGNTPGASTTNYGNLDGRKWMYPLAAGVKPISTSIGAGSKKVSTEPYYAIEDNSSRDLEHEYYADAIASGVPSSLRSEFKDGIFYIVPGTMSTAKLTGVLGEYYRRKRVGKMFCGGIVNYGFIDNWLSGSLYFAQFKIKKVQRAIEVGAEGIARYCRGIARLVIGQGRLYYRSAPFNGTSFTDIIRPTTFVDLGPRDEFIKEICIDPSLDPNCSVSRSIGATSYHDIGELLGLAINYRMDTANATGNLDMFFRNSGFTFTSNVLDGDILQLVSINNEAGIEGFDLENPRYVGYQFNVMDPETPEFKPFFQINGEYGPLPVTLELNEDGYRIRTCLNEGSHYDYNDNFVEGRLTESSQIVPFYLWDKKGTGFGSAAQRNLQSWDYSNIQQIYPLQGMTYGYNITGGTNNDSDQYVLLPMTDNFDGVTISNINLTNSVEFETISKIDKSPDLDNEYPGYSYLWLKTGTINGVKSGVFNPTGATGTLYIRYGNAGNWYTINNWDTNYDFILPKREDYYNGTKQILSTPFQFYFGLIAGKTGLDKFIDLFGPKGAFPTINN